MIYIGGGYPITQTFNPSAVSDLKVLVFKDSYSLPVQTFLSMYFREVDVIDPRYYTETSLNEYVDRNRPDIVISAVSGRAVTIKNYYAFSSKDDIYITDEKVLIKKAPLEVKSNEKDSYYECYYDKFENNTVYTLYVPGITVKEGKPEAISLCLYDKANKKSLLLTALDVETCNLFGNCQWTFETPDGGSKNLELRIYGGFLNKTKSNHILFDDLSLVMNAQK